MKNNFHQYMVHFDDFAEFSLTVTQFTRSIAKDTGLNWRLTPAGIDLIKFCEQYYPKWWKILIKKL
tara:strand:+ start:412 stop:609 length:198 start_codon:yes stop_codon:yes gene_type:complete